MFLTFPPKIFQLQECCIVYATSAFLGADIVPGVYAPNAGAANIDIASVTV